VASYSVFFGSVLIGHSDLEMHDASMGVAIGKFRPTPEYAAVRGDCIAAFADRSQEHKGLRVETSDGEVLPAEGGLMLLDAEGVPMSEVEIEVAGIPSPFHEKVFS
jgi:hypothetical protein